jgi:hypothetical protein
MQLPIFFNNFILLSNISYESNVILSFLKQFFFLIQVYLTYVTILPTRQQKDFRWLLEILHGFRTNRTGRTDRIGQQTEQDRHDGTDITGQTE